MNSSKNNSIFKQCAVAAAVALLSGAVYADGQKTRAWDMKDAHSDDMQTFSGMQHPSVARKARAAAAAEKQKAEEAALAAQQEVDSYERGRYNSANDQTSATGLATARSASDEDKSIVKFDFDSSELNDDAKKSLDQLVQVAKEKDARAVSVTIEGYTDTSGPEEYNKYLSEQRAESVKTYLQDQDLKVNNWDISAQGEKSPIADNATPDGRQENRRAEVLIQFDEGISSR